MRLWVRLVSFCLSIALLGGVMMHDAAGARMSFDMAASAVAEAQDDLCPACDQDASEQLVCDLDCTAPLLSTEGSPEILPQTVATRGITRPDDTALRTRRPGFDPAPPRTTILS
ncbi:hypothetical protein OB2597_04975 [Pseudooceanicola batsensis HTCC2597]|uniref:Uncharacterized protein n=1 Tax=Pseudooceanicola batsensis (strain ATCC BAA-863 / DSM 15984 / KCTC 12145 / HTCC2597) TaxID=252305 RepID=A3TSI0_PSEBH|nr:hypothetical protein [Pseudooceanicola batsensis]EAQ04607.1 hypothetical protein OB2597_04975 [Pseudooceanicola batsensis HTCC2597]